MTHGICAGCIAKIDAQIAAIEQVEATFPCPSCPREARPYKVMTDGDHRTILVRCPGCTLAWAVEAI